MLRKSGRGKSRLEAYRDDSPSKGASACHTRSLADLAGKETSSRIAEYGIETVPKKVILRIAESKKPNYRVHQ